MGQTDPNFVNRGTEAMILLTDENHTMPTWPRAVENACAFSSIHSNISQGEDADWHLPLLSSESVTNMYKNVTLRKVRKINKGLGILNQKLRIFGDF